jgi:hypothetical protein
MCFCGFQNKQRLFRCTSLAVFCWFVTEKEFAYCALGTEFLNVVQFKIDLYRPFYRSGG